jgi:hypothetical protein
MEETLNPVICCPPPALSVTSVDAADGSGISPMHGTFVEQGDSENPVTRCAYPGSSPQRLMDRGMATREGVKEL